MITRKLKIAALILFFGTAARGQSWTTYTNFNTVYDIVPVGDSLFCATSGGVLVLNTVNQSYQRITNIDGLGGITVKSAAIDTQSTLWFGSTDGKLSRYDLQTKKWKVNNQFTDQNSQKLDLLDIFPDGDRIWVGHNQGLAYFDRDKNGGEIKENYQNFSGMISPVSVNACLVWNNQIWIGTSAGIALADRDDLNLLDPSHWAGTDQNSGQGLSNDFVLSLTVKSDTLWVGTKSGVYRLNPADTSFSFTGLGGLEIRDLQILNGELKAATQNGIYGYGSGLWNLMAMDSISSYDIRSLAEDQAGQIRAGTERRGISNFNGSFWENLTIPGPPANVFNDAFVDQTGRLWCCNHDFGGSMFDNQNWSVFDTFSVRFMSVAVDKENQAWFGTLGKGVLRLKNGSFSIYNHLKPANALLRPVCTDPNFVAVFGVGVDAQGNRWFANRDACNGTVLVALAAGTDSTFISFKENENLNGTMLRSNSMPFCFPHGNNIWIGYIDAGLDVLNFNGSLLSKSDDQVTGFPASSFAFSLVWSVAVDKAGLVWIATDAGPYRYNPANLQLTSIGLPPQFGPQVKTIAVDERNYKFLGTPSGVVVLNPDGSFSEGFTTDNSPLTDNGINKLDYHAATGNLWIATENGLSRLALPLTTAATELSEIYAYPNPFKVELGTEKVTFAHLPFGAEIKIFTTSGELIKELDSTNQWDGRNQSGKYVASGVYLYVVKAEGKENSIGKIALIRN